MEITKRLAQFIVNHTYSMIPNEVRDLAKHTIIDTLGCCIGGHTEAREECEWIVDLVKEKKISGIVDIRDESDREGMRIVLVLRRDANAHVILNQLYKFTQMEIAFGIICGGF